MGRTLTHNRFTAVLTWAMRLLFGGIFILSGFAKSIDPWGTIYKVNDYLAVLGIDLWPNLRLVAVFALCALEFFIGVMVLTGCFRRSAPVLGALVMAFMLPFSLWIAMTNPVEDCGCFGDAVVISNWATFWKNVVLAIAAGWLCLYNRSIRSLITPALQWISFVSTALYIVVIELFGYASQPLLDFRAYKEGEPLIERGLEEDNDPSFIFIYEKDGVQKEFTEDDVLPDESDGWKFVDRKEQPHAASDNRQKKDDKTFRIWSRDGEDDVTDEVIEETGEQILIMIPDLTETSISGSWKLNSMSSWAGRNNISLLAVVAGSQEEIDEWEDLSMISYPLYTADDTAIKEVVRGNPGVVYLKNGIIEWKSTLRAIDVDDFMAPGTSGDPMSFRRDNKAILLNCTYLYLAVIAVLMVLSLLPSLKRMYLDRKTVTSDTTATDDDTARL